MKPWPHRDSMLPSATVESQVPSIRYKELDEKDNNVPTVNYPADETLESVSDSPIFTLFSKFPQEIRLKIWRATFEPRKIVIRVESDGWISPSSFSSRPVAFYVCSESREEALNCYRLIFAKSRHPTYFNPHIDIPHIRHGSRGSRRVKPDSTSPWFNFSRELLTNLRLAFDANFLSSLRKVAIDRDLWVLRMGSAAKVMSLCGKLEELFIVIDDTFLRDEDEWVDADDPEEDRRDVILFMTALSGNSKPPDGYHRAEEKFFYVLRRMKLRKSHWDFSHFKQPLESLRYAAFIKDDVLMNINEGSELGRLQKEPKIEVVGEGHEFLFLSDV